MEDTAGGGGLGGPAQGHSGAGGACTFELSKFLSCLWACTAQLADDAGKTPLEEAASVGRLKDTMAALANGSMDIDDIM